MSTKKIIGDYINDIYIIYKRLTISWIFSLKGTVAWNAFWLNPARLEEKERIYNFFSNWTIIIWDMLVIVMGILLIHRKQMVIEELHTSGWANGNRGTPYLGLSRLMRRSHSPSPWYSVNTPLSLWAWKNNTQRLQRFPSRRWMWLYPSPPPLSQW